MQWTMRKLHHLFPVTRPFHSYGLFSQKCSYILHVTHRHCCSQQDNHFDVGIFVLDSKGEMFLLLLVRDFNAWEAHCWLVMFHF